MKNKTNWLDRRINAPGPHLCLCLSKKEYKAALKELGIDELNDWIKTPQANATAHHFASTKGLTCVVCLDKWVGRNPIEIAGLLVHESVHAWQEWCNYYGESAPGNEQEAYAIQAVAQELMAEFSRRLNES